MHKHFFLFKALYRWFIDGFDSFFTAWKVLLRINRVDILKMKQGSYECVWSQNSIEWPSWRGLDLSFFSRHNIQNPLYKRV